MNSYISPGSYYKTNRVYRCFKINSVSTIIGEGELFIVVCCYQDIPCYPDIPTHHFIKSDDIMVKILYRSNLIDIAHWWVRDNCIKIV